MACVSGNTGTVTPVDGAGNTITFTPATDGYPFEDPRFGDFSNSTWWVESVYYDDGTETTVGRTSSLAQPAYVTDVTFTQSLGTAGTRLDVDFTMDLDLLDSNIVQILFSVATTSSSTGSEVEGDFCYDRLVAVATTGNEWAQMAYFTNNVTGNDNIHIAPPAPFIGGAGLGFEAIIATGSLVTDVVWWDDGSGATSDENGAFIVSGTGLTGLQWFNPDDGTVTSLTQITSTPTDGDIDGLDIDPDTNTVYYSTQSGDVGKFTLGGTVATSLTASGASSITLTGLTGTPRHLQISPSSGKLLIFTSAGEVVQLNADLTSQTTLFTGSTTNALSNWGEENSNDGLYYYNDGSDIRRSTMAGASDTLVKSTGLSTFFSARMKYNSFTDETYIYIAGGTSGQEVYEVGSASQYCQCNFRDGSRTDTWIASCKGRPIPGWLKTADTWIIFNDNDITTSQGISGGTIGAYDLSGRGAHLTPGELNTGDSTLGAMLRMHVDQTNGYLYTISQLNSTCSGTARDRVSRRDLVDLVEDFGFCTGTDNFDKNSCPSVDNRTAGKVLYTFNDIGLSFTGDLVSANNDFTGASNIVNNSNSIDKTSQHALPNLDDDGDSSFDWVYYLDADDDRLYKIELSTGTISTVATFSANTVSQNVFNWDSDNAVFWHYNSLNDVIRYTTKAGATTTWNNDFAEATVRSLVPVSSGSNVVWSGVEGTSFGGVLTSTWAQDFARAKNPFVLWNFHRETQAQSNGSLDMVIHTNDPFSKLA